MDKRNVSLRRKKVASLLIQDATEEEIANELGVDQSTISRDIKHMKLEAQKFVYNLAKLDLAWYYKQSIDGIQGVNRKALEIYDEADLKTKLLALRLVKECHEAVFSLLSQGPSVLNMKSLEERLDKIETAKGQINR
jgi:IS30 family transposase